MATRTIALEIDAYERLKHAKRGKESFSAVIRRARFEPNPCTGRQILEKTRSLVAKGESIEPDNEAYWERAKAEDAPSGRISKSAWVN